ncbi:hypothetical protein [Stieleria varia]|uniref:Uncharacterized protein n=1 Tax=Stieleria varia TaxID=2528005 RepID=A0A5C5ZZC4_9BACT|nr:hypothetical protein [Stieleria varia]TWT92407.1 hypothetical protein Pla52n_62810 [Stieleria varia]
MTIRCFELPSEIADWPDWLDRQLVGDAVAQLADEFRVAGGETTAETVALDQLIGDRRSELLARGTIALSETQLRTLIRHPDLLIELQELVLIEGGAHWLNLSADASHADEARGQWQSIRLLADATQTKVDGSEHLQQGVHRDTPRDGSTVPWMPLLAVAAALLLAVGWWFGIRETGPGWGFDNQELLSAKVQPQQYMTLLADAADDWYNKRPDTSEALAKRLEQYSQGCQILLEAPHEQLAQADREWLLERCAAWKGKIDDLRAEVIAGEKEFSVALADADQIIDKLETALRERDVVATG